MNIPPGDPKIGSSIFSDQCQSCHGIDGDGKGSPAPPLGKLFGRKAGTTAYNYSKAMKNCGIIWSPAHLWLYVVNPGLHIPGNKMAYPGLKDEQSRAHLIAYLASV